MHPRLRALVLIILVAALAGCGASSDKGATGPEITPEAATITEVGQPAPDFELPTRDGQTFRLADHRGKVVVVNFFATWCPPCREEMPHLEEKVWREFRDDRFAMIAVGREHANDELGEFVERYELSFAVAGDPERTVYAKYATQYIPRTVVIGPDGTILFQSSGFEQAELAEMIDVIESALSDHTTTSKEREAA